VDSRERGKRWKKEEKGVWRECEWPPAAEAERRWGVFWLAATGAPPVAPGGNAEGNGTCCLDAAQKQSLGGLELGTSYIRNIDLYHWTSETIVYYCFFSGERICIYYD
jgi:hypothetical protein